MNPQKGYSDNEIHIDPRLALTILITVCALILSTVTMSVCLISNAIADTEIESSYHSGENNNNEDKNTNSNNKNDQQSGSNILPGKKTDIILPAVTADGTYLTDSSQMTDISEDTDIKSAAIALIDITNGKTVAGKNADVKIFPASMTKVMTLLLGCENAKDPNAPLTVTSEMISKYNSKEYSGASTAFAWKEGDTVTVEDALHLIIYESDTFACWLIADHIFGSETQFVAKMNARAKELGLTSTSFANCTGIFNENHYTTCREMAAIMAAAMNNEAAAKVLGNYNKYSVDVSNLTDNAEESNRTVDIWSAWYVDRLEKNRYPQTAWYYAGKGSDIKFVGGKTGYETIPTSCFVTAGVNDVTGTRYVCVQVGRISNDQPTVSASESTYDTREVYQKYAKA